jgi:hypothetical protein
VSVHRAEVLAGERSGQRRPGPATGSAILAIAALAVIVIPVVAWSTGRLHWWAEFIVVPAAAITAAGAQLLARGGGRSLVGYFVCAVGTVDALVGALLMFGVMGRGWPLMIIVPALTVAGTYLWRADDPLPRGLHRTVALLALLAATLGGVFLAMRLGWSGFDSPRWWAGYMVAAGVLVLLNGVELLRHRMRYGLQAATLMAGPAALTILLGLRFLRNLPIT